MNDDLTKTLTEAMGTADGRIGLVIIVGLIVLAWVLAEVWQ